MPGATTLRGYGSSHQRRRAEWKPKVDALAVLCWRCGDLIVPDPAILGEGWDLGHDDDDRNQYRGPEHARRCNRAAAGRRQGQRKAARRRRWQL